MRFLGRGIQRTIPLLAMVFTLGIGASISSHSSVRAQQAGCSGPFESVSPALTDLGDMNYTRMDGQITTFKGGLYPNGSNQPPTEHAAAGMEAAKRIQPLDKNGRPDMNTGKIGMVSIGMSNTYSEFERFINLAEDDPEINPHIYFINGAIPGQTAQYWVDPQAQTWQELDFRLSRNKLDPLQIQVVWVKLTLTGGGKFPTKAQELQSDLEAIARNLKTSFPNLQIAFFSSRTRSYTYWNGLSPEPQAFETGFAVKWMIEKQIVGNPDLNYDPQKGEIKAPYMAWGPYLWADGINQRSDGFIWKTEDLVIDCTHPSASGNDKVAAQILAFFKSDPAAMNWFLANPTPTIQSTPSSGITHTPSLQSTRTPTPYPSKSTSIIMPSTDIEIGPTSSTTRPSSQSATPKIESIDKIHQPWTMNFVSSWKISLIGAGLIIVVWVGHQIFQKLHKQSKDK